MKKASNLWIEKYRPKTLDEIILNDNIKRFFYEFKKNGDISNILLVGAHGIGKTALSKIIAEDIIGAQFLYINASDENGIDTIRNKVKSFIQTKSINGKIKIVILDEADGLTTQSQQALRNLMESYLNNARFILTANYGHKIISPIKSRCQKFKPEYTIQDYAKHVIGILKTENVTYDKNDLLKFIKNMFPDFRNILIELEKRIIDGHLELDIINENDFTKTIWDKLLNKEDLFLIRKFVINNEISFGKDYENLLNILFDHICDLEKLKYDQKAKICIYISDALRNHSLVANPEINFFRCLIEINNSL